MKSKHYITTKNICIELSTPSFSKNEFGYFISLKTQFQIGRSGFAVVLMGFGLAIVLKRLIKPDNIWMWDQWKKLAFINTDKKADEVEG